MISQKLAVKNLSEEARDKIKQHNAITFSQVNKENVYSSTHEDSAQDLITTNIFDFATGFQRCKASLNIEPDTIKTFLDCAWWQIKNLLPCCCQSYDRRFPCFI